MSSGMTSDHDGARQPYLSDTENGGREGSLVEPTQYAPGRCDGLEEPPRVAVAIGTEEGKGDRRIGRSRASRRELAPHLSINGPRRRGACHGRACYTPHRHAQ